MGINITQNGEYNNADIKTLQHEESVDLTLLYETPIEKEGQYGKFYIVKANINDTDCSFLVNANMRSKQYGVFLIDELNKYTQGDKIRITKHVGKTAKGINFNMFEVTPLDVTEQNNTQAVLESGHEEKTSVAQPTSVRGQLLEMLKVIAKSHTKPLNTDFDCVSFANAKLKEAGIEDEELRLSVAKDFSKSVMSIS